MNDMKYIIINKNRGWRGLAEVAILNEDKDLTTQHIFSFSQDMWNDMIDYHLIVIADEEYYYVIKFEDTGRLPKPHQQRSVLIKDYTASIEKVNKIEKARWGHLDGSEWSAVRHFMKNKNNHTTSDWNCIGIRVMPSI